MSDSDYDNAERAWDDAIKNWRLVSAKLRAKGLTYTDSNVQTVTLDSDEEILGSPEPFPAMSPIHARG